MSKPISLLSAALTLVICLGISSSSIPLLAKDQSNSDVVMTEQQINNKSYLVSHVVVKASPQQVWQVLTDYTGAPKIFPTLRKCNVVADNGASKRVHWQVHPNGLLATYEYDLEMKETPHKMIEWHRVCGDFKEVDGFWKLEGTDGGRSTIVTYASYINGGLFMPQALIKRQLRIDFPPALAAMRSTAETTTQIATRTSHTHIAN